MKNNDISSVISQWSLPEDGALLERIEQMIQPALLSGVFGQSATLLLCGLQWHLGGAKDTEELAELAGVTSDDRALDVCCFLGGPAVQLASDYGCHITGIDINEPFIAAATRIASLAGLESLLEFRVADAADLPFPEGHFTVVWSQASAAHDDAWLRECDRVLRPGGRLAITIQTSPPPDPWSLPAITERLTDEGYTLLHTEDLASREIELGWRALDAKLTTNETLYTEALGKAWVNATHERFAVEITRMQAGEWSNGRIVARKNH